MELVSLWIEVKDSARTDRFTLEIACPKAAALAKSLPADALVEASGRLRHDRWRDKLSAFSTKVSLRFCSRKCAESNKSSIEPNEIRSDFVDDARAAAGPAR